MRTHMKAVAFVVLTVILCILVPPSVSAWNMPSNKIPTPRVIYREDIRSGDSGRTLQADKGAKLLQEPERASGDVIVVFRQPSAVSVAGIGLVAEKAKVNALATSMRSRVTRTYPELARKTGKTFAVIHSDAKTEKELLHELKARPDVAGAQFNYMYKASTVTPNDTKYDSLWGFSAINAPKAWEYGTGSENVYVAVIDTGVDDTHPDIEANFESKGYSGNFASDADKDDYSDKNGHGTHVAGTIAAVGNNGLGVVGVNWKAKIISLRALDANGYSYSDEIMNAMQALLKLLIIMNSSK